MASRATFGPEALASRFEDRPLAQAPREARECDRHWRGRARCPQCPTRPAAVALSSRAALLRNSLSARALSPPPQLGRINTAVRVRRSVSSAEPSGSTLGSAPPPRWAAPRASRRPVASRPASTGGRRTGKRRGGCATDRIRRLKCQCGGARARAARLLSVGTSCPVLS